MEMEHRDFVLAGLEYVCLIQEVQERKKFEFVEIVSCIFWWGRQFCDLIKLVPFIPHLRLIIINWGQQNALAFFAKLENRHWLTILNIFL